MDINTFMSSREVSFVWKYFLHFSVQIEDFFLPRFSVPSFDYFLWNISYSRSSFSCTTRLMWWVIVSHQTFFCYSGTSPSCCFRRCCCSRYLRTCMHHVDLLICDEAHRWDSYVMKVVVLCLVSACYRYILVLYKWRILISFFMLASFQCSSFYLWLTLQAKERRDIDEQSACRTGLPPTSASLGYADAGSFLTRIPKAYQWRVKAAAFTVWLSF